MYYDICTIFLGLYGSGGSFPKSYVHFYNFLLEENRCLVWPRESSNSAVSYDSLHKDTHVHMYEDKICLKVTNIENAEKLKRVLHSFAKFNLMPLLIGSLYITIQLEVVVKGFDFWRQNLLKSLIY